MCGYSPQSNPLRCICGRLFAQFQVIQPFDLHEAIAIRDDQAKGAAVFYRQCSIVKTSSN